jgi:hypothetical protein
MIKLEFSPNNNAISKTQRKRQREMKLGELFKVDRSLQTRIDFLKEKNEIISFNG